MGEFRSFLISAPTGTAVLQIVPGKPGFSFTVCATRHFVTFHLNTYIINIHVIYSNLQFFTASLQNAEPIYAFDIKIRSSSDIKCIIYWCVVFLFVKKLDFEVVYLI